MNDNRAAYIQGLRQLADVLERNPGIRLPLSADMPSHTTFLFHDRPDSPAVQALADAARAFPCSFTKSTSGEGGKWFDLLGRLGGPGGLGVQLSAYREAVCTRVVTGTREVTKKVKDPDLLERVPEVEVTETVEDVEWRCHPLLAGTERADRAAEQARAEDDFVQDRRADLDPNADEAEDDAAVMPAKAEQDQAGSEVVEAEEVLR